MKKGDSMEFITVGKIVSTHGIKGELKILSDSDFRSVRFKKGATIYINYEKSQTPCQITSYRTHKNFDLVTINNLLSINDVEKYIGCMVSVDKSSLGLLEENEYYFDDLLGLEVCLEDGTLVGQIIDVLDLPQGEVIVIERKNQKDAMIPFVVEFVKEVTKDKVIITPIEGLLL
jgi:16S rRNA processing protein RimM